MNPYECQLYTMPQAAAFLTVSKRTLERLIAAKEFPQPIKLGGSVRVPAVDIERFIEAKLRRRNSGGAS